MEQRIIVNLDLNPLKKIRIDIYNGDINFIGTYYPVDKTVNVIAISHKGFSLNRFGDRQKTILLHSFFESCNFFEGLIVQQKLHPNFKIGINEMKKYIELHYN